jgi:hypothetical protein
MPLNSIEALLYAIETTALNRDLRLQVRELRLHMRQVHLETRHTNFEVAKIPTHFLPQGVDARPHILQPSSEKMELLHNEIGGFVGHDRSLA